MRVLPILIVAAAFADIVLGQSPTPTKEPSDIDLLQWVESADPKVDLARNIAKHDTRFLVLNGISGNMRPGLASDERVAKHGTRLLEGTTCVVINNEHARLILKARDYAKDYNNLLLDYLKALE